MKLTCSLILGVAMAGLAIGCAKDESAQNNVETNVDGGDPQQSAPDGPGGFGGGGGGVGGGFDPAAIFDRRDENQDGKLTGDELTGRMADRVEQFDTDKDGEISREEFEAGMQSFAGGGGGRGGPGGGGGGSLMDNDADGDGKISLEEAPQWMQSFFGRMDADSDGFVTQQEIDAGRQQFGRGGGGRGGGRGRPGGEGDADSSRPQRPQRPALDDEGEASDNGPAAEKDPAAEKEDGASDQPSEKDQPEE